MEVEKRDGATRSAVLGTRKLPACLPACLTAACLLASHPKFPSRFWMGKDDFGGKTVDSARTTRYISRPICSRNIIVRNGG
ncbi:uncharacterized protein LOC143211881 isoform X2 [Lasioglossum baleicum]|uniref:uncharacterized protein LOC143211881 isoform X2 n=1 Tax=Lasioglossum baleicum TaxID=434251 RepID=UPI003FCCD1E2